jgi:hypothetical protein
MDIAIAKIIGGGASIDAGGDAGSRAPGCTLFCGLIRVDSKHRCWPGALSYPSPKSLGDVFGVGNKRPIVVHSADVDADLVTDV